MRRLIPFLLLLLAIPAHAQQTQTSVTGTIVDPNSVPYYPATVLACLVPATQNPTVAGAPISTNPGVPYCVGPAQTGITGTFQIPLYANSVIKCNNVTCSTQWQFTVTASGTAPPAGKGAQNFQVVAPITSLTTQDISGILTAAAPILLNSGGGGSSVGPGTPNFIGCFSVPTNLQNCTDAITDIAGLVTIPAQLSVGGGGGAASIAMPSGPTSGCQTPATGFNILCSDGTLNTFDVSLNGAAYTPIPTQSSISSGAIGQPAAYNSTSTIDNIPLYIAVDAVQGAGIGSAIVAWVSGTTYPLCQLVTNSGNFMAVSTANGATTPGTNKQIWYPLPNASRPTQFDCAFYINQSQVTATQNSILKLGMNTYNSCIGMNYPTVSSPGNPIGGIEGMGNGFISTIKQTCPLLISGGGDGLAMINVPPATTAFALPRGQWKDFTLDANGLACNFDWHAGQEGTIDHVDMLNPASTCDHVLEMGTVGGGNTGWVFEPTIRNVVMDYNPSVVGIGHGNGAFAATVTTSGGVPTITVTTAGANYGGQTTFRLVKSGALEACTSVGTFTATFNGSNGITAVTTTSTGCVATGQLVLQTYPQIAVNYGVKFSNVSDCDYVGDIVDGGIGAIAGFLVSNVTSQCKFYNLHPISTFNGIMDSGNSQFYSAQIDSVYNYGIVEDGQNNVSTFIGTSFQWNSTNLPGSSDYLFNRTVNPPINSPKSINIIGDSCGNQAHQSAYAHFINAVVGNVIDTHNAPLPPFVHLVGTVNCSTSFTSIFNDLNTTYMTSLTVSQLPNATTMPSGTTYLVTDANSTTIGSCTGGGTTPMLAVTNGTSWTCH